MATLTVIPFVVLSLHHVFGSPDLSPLSLPGFDLPIWFPPVIHSNTSHLFLLMYCLPAQMIYWLAFSGFQTILKFSCITHGSLSISSEILPLASVLVRRTLLYAFSSWVSFSSRSTFVSRHCNLPPSVSLPSCFPFLHWNRQKSFRSLPRIVWFISFFVEKVDKYPHAGNIVLDSGKDFWLGAIYMHSYDLLMVK